MRKCGWKSIFYIVVKVPGPVTSLAEVWIEIFPMLNTVCGVIVTSLAEVWIEISGEIKGGFAGKVTSLAEVWIEISYAKAQF